MIEIAESEPVQQQGACEVCERITSLFDEWSGAFLCSKACAKTYFSGYTKAVAGMLADEDDNED